MDIGTQKRVQFQCIHGELSDILKMLEEKGEYDIADKLDSVIQRVCDVERLCYNDEE